MTEKAPMPTQEQIDNLYTNLKTLGDRRGYFLNPDVDFTKALTNSLLLNEERYGYQACPCRLATGERAEDLDIICPCDYRDGDVLKYGSCYCGLYVNKNILEGKETLKSIPESRPSKEVRQKMTKDNPKLGIKNSETSSAFPVWRCTVCGYLCARPEAPEICPICGVAHDRFERFE